MHVGNALPAPPSKRRPASNPGYFMQSKIALITEYRNTKGASMNVSGCMVVSPFPLRGSMRARHQLQQARETQLRRPRQPSPNRTTLLSPL